MTVLEIPTPWEIVEDDKGFLNIHHPREDDGAYTGDLVATCFQDKRHAAMLRAAPELLAALELLVGVELGGDANAARDNYKTYTAHISWDDRAKARAAIASARGAA